MPIQFPYYSALHFGIDRRGYGAWSFLLVCGEGELLNIFVWSWLYHILRGVNFA